jgi:uncharacterized protein involved in outer membrane biogenesis
LLRIEGTGQLNGRSDSFTLDGDPLATADRDKPYRFTFVERSSGSRLLVHGSLLHPFNFRELDAKFQATGEDLKDIYFLTGVSLPDTGAYHLDGHAARRGDHFHYELHATSGQSDMRATLAIETSTGHAHTDADLDSQLLRLSDLGKRAAGRAPEPASSRQLLIPDSPLPLAGLRNSDAIVNFHAHRLVAGPVSFDAVSLRVRMDHGLLDAVPLSATVLEGKLSGQVRLDATHEAPIADLDLKIANAELGQLKRASRGAPPLEGPLAGRFTLRGRGHSLHELAAAVDGTATMVMPHGKMRASLAELSGIDFRGMGLLVCGNREETPIRCAVASFQAHQGVLTTQTLVLDTEPVLITGDGAIHLDSETLDLTLKGQPKHMRLRLRSPLSIRGTLAHPSIGIEPGKAVAQAGAAVALGLVLTPPAAALAFVDPGLAKDANCAALLGWEQDQRQATRPASPTPSQRRPLRTCAALQWTPAPQLAQAHHPGAPDNLALLHRWSTNRRAV